MPESDRPDESANRASASARLNIWALDTLARVTEVETDKSKLYESQITEDGNRYLAWSLVWFFPLLGCLGVAADLGGDLQWLFWGLSLPLAIGMLVNATQALWARRQRAALDAKINLELLSSVEAQRKQNEEILRRIKNLEERTARIRAFPDFDI